MNSKILIAAALAASVVTVQRARADVWGFSFSGAGVSGQVELTVQPNVSPTDPNASCGTLGNNPCRSDPVGAYKITNISGVFSDTNGGLNIVNRAITGLVPISPSLPRDPVFDPLVPTSLSFIDYTNEANPGSALSYDNLFYPAGAPVVCDWLFTGTAIDIYGVAFTLSNGDTAVVWGDGNYNNGLLTYGAAVTDGVNELDYQFSGIDGAIPEPQSYAIVLAGLGALGLARRRRVRAR